MKVLISGSTGLVGSRIVELLNKDFEFIPLLQSEVDITQKDAVANFLKEHNFDLFLHLAAYTNVDQAEEEKEKAYAINVTGTRHVFEETRNLGKQFIYISTDFVFDGENPSYFEDSPPNPVGYYGQTKYEGEKIVQGQAMIVRLSFPYRASHERPDFTRTLKSLLEKKTEIKAITDSQITPTFIDDIAYAFKYLLNNFSQEVFHVVGKESLSPYSAALEIARVFDLNTNLIKQTTFNEFYKGRAPRPKQSVIKSRKNTFYPMKSFSEGLAEIKKQLENQH